MLNFGVVRQLRSKWKINKCKMIYILAFYLKPDVLHQFLSSSFSCSPDEITTTNLQGFLQWKESVAPGDCNSFRASVLSYLDHLILLQCSLPNARSPIRELEVSESSGWSHWNEQCFSNKVIYTGNSTWFQICLLHENQTTRLLVVVPGFRRYSCQWLVLGVSS